MTMTKRDGVFYADLRAFGGERVSLKTRDPEVARTLYRKAVAALDDMRPKGATKMTLLEAYRRCRAETKWATAKDQRGITARWAGVTAYLNENTPLYQIDRDRLSKLVGQMRMERGISDKTVNRHLALLSKVLRWAADGGHLDSMPAIPWIEVPKSGRIRFYSEAEEKAILGAFKLNDPVMRDLTVFLLDTGWRISEALSPGFHQEGRVVYLWDQKGGTRTGTPLTTRAYEAAVSHTWMGLSVDQVYKRWVKMAKGLGLGEGANVHACRHTTATRLAQRGMPPHQIQAFMRHADIRTTMIYVHLAAGDLEACAAALEQSKEATVEMLQEEKREDNAFFRDAFKVCQEGDDEGTLDCGTVSSASGTPLIPLPFLAPRPGLEPGTCGLTVRVLPDESKD